ncbi:MAG: rod shape-determining protein MreC [Elusimicrobiota bacterium]|nr:rod shape-determining protein MreC [Elusimicrobiota bacterium]
MHDSRRGKILFVVFLLLSAALCFIVPARKTKTIRLLTKYIYYTPYAKSREALLNLTSFPGKVLNLAGQDRMLRACKQKLFEKDYELVRLDKELDKRKAVEAAVNNRFSNRFKLHPVFPYGSIGKNSNILLIRNSEALFGEGAPVICYKDGAWLLVGAVGKDKEGSVSECELISNKAFRVSVSGEDSSFWGVLIGYCGGECFLDFVWPSRDIFVKKGDRLVTSGWDGKFPPGLYCGTVMKVVKSRAGEYKVTVKTAYNANVPLPLFVLTK